MDNQKIVKYMFASWKDALEQIAAQVDAGNMTPERAAEVLATKTICILGKPGIGKSSTAHDLADMMTAHIRADAEAER